MEQLSTKQMEQINSPASSTEKIIDEKTDHASVKSRLRKINQTEEKMNIPKKRKHGIVSLSRRLWNSKEDEAIENLVKKYGDKKWTLIAKKLDEEYSIIGRTGKQCRER